MNYCNAPYELGITPKLLTITETCAVLKLNRENVYKLVHSRALPSVRLEGRYLVPPYDVAMMADKLHPVKRQPGRANEIRRQPSQPKPLTIAEAAVAMRVGRRTIISLINSGRLKETRVGHRNLIKPIDLWVLILLLCIEGEMSGESESRRNAA